MVTAMLQPALAPARFEQIPAWAEGNHDQALAAFRRSAVEMLEQGRAFSRDVRFGGQLEDWTECCRAALAAGNAHRFFEQHFSPLAVQDSERPEGLFTGYYEAEATGSRTPGEGFEVPIYRKPPDLVRFDASTETETGIRYGQWKNGKAQPYLSRGEIEAGALEGHGLEIVWLNSWADAFFIHIQGSGRVHLPDGQLLRLAYTAKNGRPYTGIGHLLVSRGLLRREDMSMQGIRAWMKEHPDAARELMWENQSFIFFRELTVCDPLLGPPGAQNVSLTPLCSLAVDRSVWAFGTPVWLDTTVPSATGGPSREFRRLMIAQDTGSAIKGLVRGDVFWGAGPEAALIAGHMKSPGRMIVLLPKPLASRLVAAS